MRSTHRSLPGFGVDQVLVLALSLPNLLGHPHRLGKSAVEILLGMIHDALELCSFGHGDRKSIRSFILLQQLACKPNCSSKAEPAQLLESRLITNNSIVLVLPCARQRHVLLMLQ
jgi:hypothetical protein